MIKYCYILDDYYKDNPNLIKILDEFDESKHNIRTHLCLNIQYKNNNVLIPLRKNLGDAVRKFGRIGYSVPSESKPKAGLDYRYIMIINDIKYLRFDKARISNSQQKIIEHNYTDIEKQAISYIEEYVKVAKKGRVKNFAKFRESSLINFYKELEIESQ